MKKLVFLLPVIFIAVFLVSSCKKGTSPSSQEEASGDTVVLEGLYATSISFPHDKFRPEKLFDGDGSTVWATMPGAAPDEGVFLQFERPVKVDKITIDFVNDKKNNFVQVTSYQLYVNGLDMAAKMAETVSTIDIGKYVGSLYVRILSVEGMEKNPKGIVYKKDLPAAVSELSFISDGKKLKIIPPKVVKGGASASSCLEPAEAYSPDFLFDSRKDFGWADGHSDKTGLGENLTFTFENDTAIEKIKIWNGYQRSNAHYFDNERVKKMSFGITGGKNEQYDVKDENESQIIDLKEKLTGKSFTLNINDIYPGKAYKDLVISEMRFFDGKDWFIIDTGGAEKRKKEIISAASSNGLKGIIDKDIAVNDSKPDNNYFLNQSLIIRSNGSFIFWKKEDDSSSSKTVYADGNWQLKDNKVRLFGRIHKIEQYENTEAEYNPYSGKTSQTKAPQQDVDSIKIFQDFLVVTKDSITSEKNLFAPFKF